MTYELLESVKPEELFNPKDYEKFKYIIRGIIYAFLIIVMSTICIFGGVMLANKHCTITKYINTTCSLYDGELYIQKKYNLDIGTGIILCQQVTQCPKEPRCNDIGKKFIESPRFCASTGNKHEYILTDIHLNALSIVMVVLGISIVVFCCLYKLCCVSQKITTNIDTSI